MYTLLHERALYYAVFKNEQKLNKNKLYIPATVLLLLNIALYWVPFCFFTLICNPGTGCACLLLHLVT